MIQVDNITYSYPEGATIFANFSWQVERGEAWAVIGPSGCGKSTLLYLLAGLRLPEQGHILVDGLPVSRPRPRTGLILQDYGLLPWATVQQNAMLGINIRGFYGPDGKHAPSESITSPNASLWLERLGLADLADQFPGQLSGGQRQRTAIARTLALQPDLLLMDEPFSSLDAPTRENMQNLTLELKAEQGLTLIVVTHAIEEAAVLGDKILMLSRIPNRQAAIISNPSIGEPGYRNSQAYFDLCQSLRQLLDSTQ